MKQKRKLQGGCQNALFLKICVYILASFVYISFALLYDSGSSVRIIMADY